MCIGRVVAFAIGMANDVSRGSGLEVRMVGHGLSPCVAWMGILMVMVRMMVMTVMVGDQSRQFLMLIRATSEAIIPTCMQ